jgi:glutathione S-transferase
MSAVDFVIGLMLVEYFVFVLAVGRARVRYQVAAPATTGHPEFERFFRVQMNTLEQLIIVIPCMWMFARYIHEPTAAILGLIFIVGRALYFTSYTRDPKSRGWGFMISSLPMLTLLVGSMIGAARDYLTR